MVSLLLVDVVKNNLKKNRHIYIIHREKKQQKQQDIYNTQRKNKIQNKQKQKQKQKTNI